MMSTIAATPSPWTVIIALTLWSMALAQTTWITRMVVSTGTREQFIPYPPPLSSSSIERVESTEPDSDQDVFRPRYLWNLWGSLNYPHTIWSLFRRAGHFCFSNSCYQYWASLDSTRVSECFNTGSKRSASNRYWVALCESACAHITMNVIQSRVHILSILPPSTTLSFLGLNRPRFRLSTPNNIEKGYKEKIH